MQLGYSLKLSETVPAASAEYEDCAKYQLTCPACREAVFKGVKTAPREVHYFSHYRSSGDDQCELRVANMAREAGAVDGFIGHGQSLDRFMATFRDSIVTAYRDLSGVDVRRRALEIYGRPYMDDLDGIFDAIARTVETAPRPRDLISELLNRSPVFKGRSLFWCRRSASYVLDVIRHLTTTQAKPNRRFLVAMAFAVWPRRKAEFAEWGEEPHPAKMLAARISEAGSTSAVRHLMRVTSKQIDTLLLKEIGTDAAIKMNQPTGHLTTAEETKHPTTLQDIKAQLAELPPESHRDYLRIRRDGALNDLRRIDAEEAANTAKTEAIRRRLLNLKLTREVYVPTIGLLAAGFDLKVET